MQLLVENGRIRSLGARWDMRRPNLPMLGHVVSVARDLRLVLLDVERKRIVPPDINALLWPPLGHAVRGTGRIGARFSRVSGVEMGKQHNNRWRDP
jgi:hypothetical protein